MKSEGMADLRFRRNISIDFSSRVLRSRWGHFLIYFSLGGLRGVRRGGIGVFALSCAFAAICFGLLWLFLVGTRRNLDNRYFGIMSSKLPGPLAFRSLLLHLRVMIFLSRNSLFLLFG